MHNALYNEITLLLFATAMTGLVALRLRQPVIAAYILIGIVAVPSLLGWVGAHEPMELLAEIGVTILLFVVGLKLDIHRVRTLGAVALATGLGHVDAAALGLVTLAGLITITTGTCMILYSQRLHVWCEPWLRPFERRDPFRGRALDALPASVEVIVFGMGRYGRRLAERLHAQGLRVLGVDSDGAADHFAVAEGGS